MKTALLMKFLINEAKLHLFMQYEMIYSKKKQKELSFLIL